ncbi:hypothetical protein U9M48_016729 [Paspalum notatum var. saurae]|uniref:RRM domain-containing protein n=1 Tax=Paspalum notatum var. saurae TaxID=547442 RepID=A0AAQ3TA48_PASNO
MSRKPKVSSLQHPRQVNANPLSEPRDGWPMNKDILPGFRGSPAPVAGFLQLNVFSVHSSMAAFNKLGSLLRHGALASRAPAGLSPAVFNAARLMSTKLFVGGLSWDTNDQSLKEAFSTFGEVTEARVITDRESGRSRGFGFVSFTNSDEAKAAVQQMDGQELEGRSVRVNFANERPAGNRGGGGGYGGGFNSGGGGYGGGYGGNNQSYGAAGGQDGY